MKKNLHVSFQWRNCYVLLKKSSVLMIHCDCLMNCCEMSFRYLMMNGHLILIQNDWMSCVNLKILMNHRVIHLLSYRLMMIHRENLYRLKMSLHVSFHHVRMSQNCYWNSCCDHHWMNVHLPNWHWKSVHLMILLLIRDHF
jgi:hypothetical protein